MTCIDVTTQQELDAALAHGDHPHIRSEPDARLIVSGSASVEAWGSASVVARGSASVVARGSASVVARGSASVEAWDSASVEASKYVAIQRHGDRVVVREGTIATVIDIPACDRLDDWCDYHGVETDEQGRLILFKGVGDGFRSERRHPDGTECVYPPGETVVAPRWRNHPYCGDGLHLSPSPVHTLAYAPEASRWVAVAAHPADTVVIAQDYGIPDKVKAASVEVLFEVDRQGRRAPGAST